MTDDLQKPKIVQPTKTSSKLNDPKIHQLPDDMMRRAQDIATESDQFDLDRKQDSIDAQTRKDRNDGKVDLDLDPDIKNVQYTGQAPPHYMDEQSVSGTNADPDSDNDMLQNAQDMGMQMEEDSENPEEIDIARDINKAEKFVHDQ